MKASVTDWITATCSREKGGTTEDTYHAGQGVAEDASHVSACQLGELLEGVGGVGPDVLHILQRAVALASVDQSLLDALVLGAVFVGGGKVQGRHVPHRHAGSLGGQQHVDDVVGRVHLGGDGEAHPVEIVGGVTGWSHVDRLA